MPDDTGPDQYGFTQLLAWLDPDKSAAGSKYERIRSDLIRVFSGRGCHEAEDLADRTIDRVLTVLPSIIDTYKGEPALYFYGTAKNIYREWLRRPPVQNVSAGTAFEPDEPDSAAYSCLESCLEKLRTSARELIVRYYDFDDDVRKNEARRSVAEGLGIGVGALHVRASRIRERLRSCVHSCVAGS